MACILVFDDEADYGVLLRRLLERSGHTVAMFSDRTSVQEWALSNHPDLVIVNSTGHSKSPKMLRGVWGTTISMP